MTEIIDLKDGLERVQDDKELLLELFDIFTEDFQGKYVLMQAALGKGDGTAFHMLAHGFKGATGNISARKMNATAVELDALSKTGDLSKVAPLVDLLGKQFEEFQVEAARLKKELGK